MKKPITTNQLTLLALLGTAIVALFAAAFVWLYYAGGAVSDGDGELFLTLAPYWVYSFLIVNSVYAGYFAVSVARGRWKYVWPWAVAGVVVTLGCIIGFPGLMSPIFPNSSPVIFAGPAMFAFAAPLVSGATLWLFISLRRAGAA